MRVANCKIVRREIEEADYGENLAASVIEHLAGCGQCQTFYDERGKLRQLVASLETVAAPPDFHLGVRSRLANERVGASAGSLFSNFTFGFPSIALATLVLAIGGFFALKAWNAQTTNTTAGHIETPKTGGPSQREQLPSTESGLKSDADSQVVTNAKHEASDAIRRDLQPKKKRSPVWSAAVAASRNGRHLATREFSITAAPVVKREEAVASLESPIFLIEASSQPLRLSLDYSGGVSRTISVPALSFGSERVLAEGGLSLVKNSPKGAW